MATKFAYQPQADGACRRFPPSSIRSEEKFRFDRHRFKHQIVKRHVSKYLRQVTDSGLGMDIPRCTVETRKSRGEGVLAIYSLNSRLRVAHDGHVECCSFSAILAARSLRLHEAANLRVVRNAIAAGNHQTLDGLNGRCHKRFRFDKTARRRRA